MELVGRDVVFGDHHREVAAWFGGDDSINESILIHFVNSGFLGIADEDPGPEMKPTPLADVGRGDNTDTGFLFI